MLDPSAPVFQWKAVTGFSGLTGYQVNVYDQTLSKFYSYQVGASVTSFSPPASILVAGDKFVWNVRILDGTTTGPESNYLYFQAAPAAPVATLPCAGGDGSGQHHQARSGSDDIDADAFMERGHWREWFDGVSDLSHG